MLSIVSSKGQELRTLELREYQEQVDLGALPPGLYVLIRRTSGQVPEYVKVIRQ